MAKKYEIIMFPADDIDEIASSPKLSGLRAQGYTLSQIMMVDDQGKKKVMALMEPPYGQEMSAEVSDSGLLSEAVADIAELDVRLDGIEDQVEERSVALKDAAENVRVIQQQLPAYNEAYEFRYLRIKRWLKMAMIAIALQYFITTAVILTLINAFYR